MFSKMLVIPVLPNVIIRLSVPVKTRRKAKPRQRHSMHQRTFSEAGEKALIFDSKYFREKAVFEP